MSSPTAAYCSPFRLLHVSPSQSAFLSLPLELRHIVYAEIFKPSTYPYKITNVRLNPRPCRLSHKACSRRSGGAVSLLRTCQQIYVEAQPHFLLSATLKLDPIEDQDHQLWSFHQMFLRSSLSGLIPGDCLRGLDLEFDRIMAHAVYDNLNFINDCRLRLNYLRLRFDDGGLLSYCSTDFTYSGFFEAMSLLRDIKNVQLTWGSVSRGYMDFTLVRASDEPVIYTQYFTRRWGTPSDSPEFEAYLYSIQKRYCGLLNRAFSELTSRPRMTKDHKQSTTLYGEARMMFLVRMRELMEESRLYLPSNT
jgi:hypothetical protein